MADSGGGISKNSKLGYIEMKKHPPCPLQRGTLVLIILIQLLYFSSCGQKSVTKSDTDTDFDPVEMVNPLLKPKLPGIIRGVYFRTFRDVSLEFENGKKLIIEAPGNGKKNIYVSDVLLNGKSLIRNYIKHTELQSGGRLTFKMQDTPDKNRGTAEDAFPFSMSNGK